MGNRRHKRRRTRGLLAVASAGLAALVVSLVWFSPFGPGATKGGAARVVSAAAPSSSAAAAHAIPATAAPSRRPPASPRASADASPRPSADAGSARASAKPAARRTPSAPAGPTASSAAGSGAVPAGYRRMSFVNHLQQKVWLAATPDQKHPLAATGWVLPVGGSVSVNVPDQWGGRFWGRTGCVFDGAGRGHCETGDCAGGFQCTGSGAVPATLAEYALGAWGGMDFYDVSMVDGSNLPMYINIVRGSTKDPVSPTGCSAGGCTHPVVCPTAMQVKASGRVVACKTACDAFGTDDYCCRGAWAGRDNCVPEKWPVDYAATVFKKAEPYAYSYAFDDSATMACRGGCYYRVTFGVTGSG
jgi:hypothetical protein